MEEKKQKRYSDSNFNILYIIVVLLIFVYFSIWFIAKNRMKEILSNKTAKYNIEYEKLSVIVLPFSIRTSIKNLVLSSGLEGKFSTSITFKKIIAKNIIFNKHVHIDVDGDILFNVNDRNSKITLEDDDISFVLGKNNKIKDVNFVANSIYIEESIDNSEVKSESTMKGFLFRIIEVGTKNYSNRTMTMNVDSIVGKYKDIYLENNFSMIVSEMLDIDSKGKIFSSQTNIDDISYNDITNNYGFNMHGQYEVNPSKGRGISKLELKIINYNSLISALNNENSVFLFNKDNVRSIVEMLELIPGNDKDNLYDKYYVFESNIATKSMNINGKNVKDLFKNFSF